MRLTGADVFDGKRWLAKADVTVAGGRVADVGTRHADTDQQVVDVSGHCIIPGLVDSHLHLFPGFLSRLPVFGVTAAVDMFSTPRLLKKLREEERIPGAARFLSAGTGAAPAGGHPHQLADQGMYDPFAPVDHPDQVAGFVADRVAEGAAFVKVFLEDGAAAGRTLPVLPPATLRCLVDGAHAQGLSVVAHATTTAAALEAIRAGVDGLAHLPVPEPERGRVAGLVEAIAEAGVFVISTLVSLASLLGQDDIPGRLTSLTRHRLGPRWCEHLALRAGPRDDPAWERVLELCAGLVQARVPLLAGTDAAFPGVPPGAALHAELGLLRGCGMSSADALTAASALPARVFGLEGGGRLYPGSNADLVVLRNDPRAEIAATQDIVATMVRGRLLTWTSGSRGLPAGPGEPAERVVDDARSSPGSPPS